VADRGGRLRTWLSLGSVWPVGSWWQPWDLSSFSSAVSGRHVAAVGRARHHHVLLAQIVVERRADVRKVFARARARWVKNPTDVVAARPRSPVLLDTSAIIDGRIADISTTGFITGELVVPRFVLDELQRIADSPDVLRRNRGRRGLDMLNRMSKDSGTPISVLDVDAKDIAEVDGKLVQVAKRLVCPIITNDFNLNRVAELQGVTVLTLISWPMR